MQELRCPNCNAPYPPSSSGPEVTCEYCHVTTSIAGALSGAPASSDSGSGPDDSYGTRLALFLAFHLYVGFGASFVIAPLTFARGLGMPEGTPILLAVVVGLAALLFAAKGQRLISVIVGAAVGGSLVLKPFLRPLVASDGDPFSPTSETACYFLIPGGCLLAVTVLIAIALKKGDLRPTAPRLFEVVTIGLGLFLAAGYGALPTRYALVSEHQAWLKETRARLQEGIRTAGPSALAAPLDPSLRYDRKDPQSNVQFLSREQLENPSSKTGHFYPNGDALLDMFRAAGLEGPIPDAWHSLSSARFAQAVTRARSAAYAVVYVTGDSDIHVQLLDVATGKVLLDRRVECAEPNGILDGPRAVFRVLREHANAEIPEQRF